MTRTTPVKAPIPTLTAIYLAARPTETLSEWEIAEKFGSERSSDTTVRNCLYGWVAAGYFIRRAEDPKKCPKTFVYSAGPALLKQIPALPPTVREGWDQPMARFPS